MKYEIYNSENIPTFILAMTVLCEILLTRLGTAWGTEKNLEEESVPVMFEVAMQQK